MPLQNKNRIAYLGALTLLFSYAEMMLPRIIPFFRLGLGNIVILLALNMDFPSFLILTFIKSISACLMAGTLFSPFFLISLSQSVISGITMFLLYRCSGKSEKLKWISLYGISLAGSGISAVIQILLSSIYIGKGTFGLLGPMLIFSVFSGIITAFLSQGIRFPENAPVLKNNMSEFPKQNESFVRKTIPFLLILIALACAIFVMMQKNLFVLAACLAIGFILQKICGRKIKFMPHLFMWIFILIANLFVPSGKILFELGKIKLTDGAFLSGLEKSLKLSVLMTISQCCTKISFSGNSLIALVFEYFNALSEILSKTNGNLLVKLKTALQATELN